MFADTDTHFKTDIDTKFTTDIDTDTSMLTNGWYFPDTDAHSYYIFNKYMPILIITLEPRPIQTF